MTPAHDLVVHCHRTLREVLAWHDAPRFVVASGRVAATSQTHTTFDPDLRSLVTAPAQKEPSA